MSLQQHTLHRYRQLFPNDTLREVSARTGIQITRVFRLFSGKTMKVGELEAFQSVIERKLAENPQAKRLQHLLNDALGVLTIEEMEKINAHVERKIRNKTFARMYISTEIENAIA